MTEAEAEQCDSYTTPVLAQTANRLELLVMGGNQVDAYEPDQRPTSFGICRDSPAAGRSLVQL